MRILQITQRAGLAVLVAGLLLGSVGCPTPPPPPAPPVPIVLIVDTQSQTASHVLREGQILTWQADSANIPFIIYWNRRVCEENQNIWSHSVNGRETATCKVLAHPVPRHAIAYYGIGSQKGQTPPPPPSSNDDRQPAVKVFGGGGDGGVVPCPGCDYYGGDGDNADFHFKAERHSGWRSKGRDTRSACVSDLLSGYFDVFSVPPANQRGRAGDLELRWRTYSNDASFCPEHERKLRSTERQRSCLRLPMHLRGGYGSPGSIHDDDHWLH